MIAKIVIDKKREGHALGSAEIREFVEGFTAGEIPDYQMAALAMAICCRGMNEREVADLTEAMRASGKSLEWPGIKTADKHSTGGVGDKLSLVVQPLAAAAGVFVPSLTGRALGLTGGTADKLETIPGYSASLSLSDFDRVVRECGVSMTVQTDEITPADRKLYALRDVTGTVASQELIAASILSKKLAEGASTLVFDVKCGSGAFMKTREEALELANRLVSGARAAGRRAGALVTDMSSPLGYAVGNANEVAEAIDILSGRFSGQPLVDLCIELAAMMVQLELELPLAEARIRCRERLADGSALARFEAMVGLHGGDLGKFGKVLEKPTFKFRIQAMKSGWVAAIDAERVAKVAFQLGAGRAKATDAIDPRAGVTLAVRAGDRVSVGSALATLERSESPDNLEKCAGELYKAFSIGAERVEPADSLILERIS
jgi:pyrimidine-nucleoside phosphorylase